MDPVKGTPAKPFNYTRYIYVHDNPLRYIDELGLFFIWMELQVGASGKDIVALRDTLKQKGFAPSVDYITSYDYLDSWLMDTVKRFYNDQLLQYQNIRKQIQNGINVSNKDLNELYRLEPIANRAAVQDYRIDSVFWKYLGLEINQTLEQEFWSGTINPNNKALNISISGNVITIDYFPKIYAFCANGHISGSDYIMVKNLIAEGFKMWEGKNYKIMGLTNIEVIVNFNPQRVFTAEQSNLQIDFDYSGSWSDRSITPSTTMNWTRDRAPAIWFDFVNEFSNTSGSTYYSGTQKKIIDPITHTAMHEFGHVLGLFDAYHLRLLNARKADDLHAKKDDVMLNDPTQIVYGYNIAMMLYAFQNNSIQNYANGSIVGSVSEIYYRNIQLE